MKSNLNTVSICLLMAASTKLNGQSSDNQRESSGTIEIDRSQIRVESVLTEEEQNALSPSKVLEILRAGNERFVRNDLTARDHTIQIRESADAQFPKAIVLSCVDSRVPVEDVFDKGIGDIFVARVAGNFINDDILGSMEFATKVAGAKLILVLGHENFGPYMQQLAVWSWVISQKCSKISNRQSRDRRSPKGREVRRTDYWSMR